MEGTGTRWLVTLCLLTAAQCIPSRITSQSEMDSEDSRRVLGSSVVTSVSVIMDHGNGTKTYFADGQSKNVHKPATDTIIGSPGNLLSPDRYEFYTFDDTGDLVKRLMTLDEIHGLIAGADPESVIADTSPTYYHDALSSHSSEALMHLPATELESLDAPAVHRVLESVQNVLKNEMAANSGKPVPTMPPGAQSLHRPDSASAWSALFPGLIETPDDVAHLSGYLLPSKTAGTESTDKLLLLSKKPSATTTKMPPPPSSSQRTQPTTESVRSTPKYTTARPESSTVTTEKTASSTYGSAIASKPPTTKKPFRPVQSFDKQKPTATLLQKPALAVRPSTKRPPPAADGLDINKEMSASISDMLSQVTDSRPVSADHHKPLQTNALLIDKDNAADYVPEESSPELSYYSPVAMALSTAGTSKPVTESLVSAAKRPPPPPTVPNTTPFKTASSTSERPYAQKPTPSVFATTRFGPHKSNATKTRPSGTNVTMTATASYNGGNTAKPFSYSNKFNNGSSSSTVSTTRNNYQYPPSNMSTKYMQKVPQTTQTYPNKLTVHSIKVVNNKTTENATTTPSVKQPAAAASWNFTVDDETKNKYVKEPNKVFQNKVTSGRPNNVNRTNVTLSNRVQESKTTAAPGFSSGFPTTTVRGQTTPEPDKFVSVKVEEWPGTTAGQQQQRPTAATVDPSTSSTPYASTEKSFFTAGNSGQSLQNAITDANTIRDLISSLITKSSTAATVSDISTTTPTTISASTTTTGTSTTTTTTTTTTTSTTASPASTVGTVQQTLTAAASTTVPTIPVKPVTGIPATYISSTTEVPVTTNGSTSSMTAATTAATTTTATAATAETSAVKTSATTTETLTTASKTATTTVASTTPESETQYVPVTHFLPELQVKDSTETEQNNGTPTVQVDSMLKDGISAVANMLQNTQKPPVIQNAAAVQEYQEIGERPYEKVTAADENKSQSLSTVVGEGKTHSSSTEQARKQATVKSDFKDTTAATDGVAFTQEPYELTTATTTTAAESTAKYTAEPTDGVAFESTTTEQLLSRVSEPGLEMMTVFNVSSTGGPTQQAAKLADLSAAETRLSYDATTPFENVPVVSTTDPPAATATEEPTVTTPVAVPVTSTAAATTTSVTTTTTTITSTSTSSTSTTPAPLVEIVPNATVTVATPSIIAHPGPSSNAYRPLISNNASPSTVELHPAPHESMGLEASVAFLGDDVRRFADLCNELSFKMWTAVTGKGQIASRSLVLSPFELTAMLAMVFLGARGSTSGQMNDVLRLDDMVTFNPHQVLRNITHSITNANNPGVATASFVREIYSNKGNGKILEFYKERVQQYYDGHVEEVDFNTIGDVLRRRTNLLVKRQTLGRVVEYLRGSGLSLTPPFAAFSANVFQTSCESASTEGRDGEMYFVVRPSTRQRRLVPVPAAVWRSGFLAGYEPGLDATAVCLSPDSAVSTILVLPGQQGQVAPGDGLTRLEQRLIETSYRRGGWSRILRSLLPRPGLELQVPRFSHRSVLNATAALQKMGLKDVFSDQKADLRGVNGLYDLYLSDMLQVNTFSTCGEDVIGARHHVETYPASPQRMGRVEMLTDRRRRKRHAEDLPLHSPYSHLPLNLRPRQARLPDVPRLRFDRPFLYLVRHNPTGMIVYLGRFNPRLLP